MVIVKIKNDFCSVFVTLRIALTLVMKLEGTITLPSPNKRLLSSRRRKRQHQWKQRLFLLLASFSKQFSYIHFLRKRRTVSFWMRLNLFFLGKGEVVSLSEVSFFTIELHRTSRKSGENEVDSSGTHPYSPTDPWRKPFWREPCHRRNCLKMEHDQTLVHLWKWDQDLV